MLPFTRPSPVFLQALFPYFSKPLSRISLGPSSAADHEQRLFCPTGDGKKFEDASSACLLTYIDICESSCETFKDCDYIKFVLERKIQQIDNADISC